MNEDVVMIDEDELSQKSNYSPSILDHTDVDAQKENPSHGPRSTRSDRAELPNLHEFPAYERLILTVAMRSGAGEIKQGEDSDSSSGTDDEAHSDFHVSESDGSTDSGLMLEQDETVSRTNHEAPESQSSESSEENSGDLDTASSEPVLNSTPEPTVNVRDPVQEDVVQSSTSSANNETENQTGPRKQYIQLSDLEQAGPASSQSQPPRGGLYSNTEDCVIVKYIISNNAYANVKGTGLWREMVRDRVCPGRTWQSLRERFLKHIVKRIRKFATDKQVQKFQQGLCWQTAKSSHASPAKTYSEKEDLIIIKYLLKSGRYKLVGGTVMWKAMENDRVLPGRTWQSIREHFRRQLVHNLDHKVSPENAKALRSYCPGPKNTE